MAVRVTCYGGVGEIGGNKFLLEDKDTKVLLDFGAGFNDGTQYFDSGIKPRGVNGAGDLFEFGLLPEIPGLYSEEALQNTELKHRKPEVDAIVLSHYHWDHTGRIQYVDPAIPVHCGETTARIHEAYSEAGDSALDGHELKTFRTGDTFTIGSMEFVPVHVDHSIPGAYGFIIHTTAGVLAYTGDFRFHGPAGSMTRDFVQAARAEKPALLISEGTRVSPKDPKSGMSERAVLNETLRVMGSCGKLVFSSFRGNDIDRINTFAKAAEATGRQLIVSMKTGLMLEKLANDGGIKVPKLGKDAFVYVRRKGSGRIDDKDYRTWERRFLADGRTASQIRENQRSVFLHLETWNLPETIDIRPEKGGVYLHSSTEAFNEEGETEEVVVRNWIDHLGFSYHQIHASGHAPMDGVRKMVAGVGAKRVVPVHTENPSMFTRFAKGVVVPQKAKAISLET
ncbi:MAG: MBL fold metallo-hydrolase [Nitrososphaerales archaeon]|nr:MBL fold metallo-hydrolase [Nitrososphaerales archaeon]